MKCFNLAEDAEDFTGNVWFIDGSENILVDVGTGDSWEEIEELEEVDKVVITHSHYDHVDNLSKVVDRFGPEVYCFEPGNIEVDAEKLVEGDEIKLSGHRFVVFHTPGHKNDSICLYNESRGILFTGDLVFPDGGFGRTDLDEGDRDVLIDSIRKLVDLDVEVFYPGHQGVVGEDAGFWIRKSLEEAEKRESKY